MNKKQIKTLVEAVALSSFDQGVLAGTLKSEESIVEKRKIVTAIAKICYDFLIEELEDDEE